MPEDVVKEYLPGAGRYPLWMAPMAGVTDRPFRTLVREQGCQLVFTEMISAKAIRFGNRRTMNMLDIQDQNPVAVQIFGSDPEAVADAARVAQDEGAVLVDINMGCPAPKIVGNGDGAALMKNPALAESLVRAAVAAVSIPVTVKFRSGWDETAINCVEFAQRMAAAGASTLTVHPRTRDQFYSGRANWELIGQVVQAVDIPVIGNGDIATGKDALDMLSQTNCHGLMVARGALGNPWLFREIHAALEGQDYQPPELNERVDMALRHFDMQLNYRGEHMGLVQMRKHLAWYLKGVPGGARLRQEIVREQEPEAVRDILRSLLL